MEGRLVTFRDFMKIAVEQYYSSPFEKIGPAGDFFTAPELDRVFGYTLADFIKPLISRYREPVILELGAGTGKMAYDILSYFYNKDPDFAQRLQYIIYERSNYMVEIQMRTLSSFKNVSWVTYFPDVEGIVISNEFFDALPVHVIKGDKELYVSEDGKEVWMDIENERVRDFVNRMGYGNLKGYRIEVPLDAIDFLKKIADALKSGYNLIIDYGYTSEEIKNYPEGTVVGYSKHRVIKENLYSMAGSIDITAHVNFSAIIDYGRDFSLEPCFLKNLRDFLMDSSMFIKSLLTLNASKSPEEIERFTRLKTMLVSMGDRFKVLLQRKKH